MTFYTQGRTKICFSKTQEFLGEIYSFSSQSSNDLPTNGFQLHTLLTTSHGIDGDGRPTEKADTEREGEGEILGPCILFCFAKWVCSCVKVPDKSWRFFFIKGLSLFTTWPIDFYRFIRMFPTSSPFFFSRIYLFPFVTPMVFLSASIVVVGQNSPGLFIIKTRHNRLALLLLLWSRIYTIMVIFWSSSVAA